jgi:hypothetical protein
MIKLQTDSLLATLATTRRLRELHGLVAAENCAHGLIPRADSERFHLEVRELRAQFSARIDFVCQPKPVEAGARASAM